MSFYNKLLSRQHRANSTQPVDENRRSGRSTALALDLLSRAIRFPGEWILARDHYDTMARHNSFTDEVMQMAKTLGLKHIERDYGNGPRIRSNHFTANPWEIQ